MGAGGASAGGAGGAGAGDAGAGGAEHATLKSSGGADPCDVYDTATLVDLFVDRTLPKAAWTHKAHLRVGLWHVREHGGARALGLLRRRISGYNEAVGTANTADSGYHETLTRFYVRMIEAFLAGHAARRDAIVDLPLMERALVAAIGDRGLPLRYYSRERLFTEAARRRWVTPDLQALPPTRRAAARPARSLDGFECRLNESSFSVKATPRGAGQKQR